MAGDPPRGGAPADDDMPLRGSAEPLASSYDVALLDLDGVVYLGGAPIPGAAEALAKAAASGMRLAFVTNNASRTPSAPGNRRPRTVTSPGDRSRHGG